ncbi:hypothetical protein CABS01_13004 [Colletotrichum abscissum]|uniref:Uncharacterized protein n=1 Tax=Colletotrichum abscissum TaxID=1671311 RepID=A0A9P9XLQ7_9PEZI|nr:uncharacterized protein CABS01_13004 [Colletotrichum abscissum]KAI3527202.1 hypothetical protein CSPX01_17166 [Colletotrichum filicis]KAI3556134.1 hypothetical protein CABS02_03843 [Colletotrichum abscissum]KAK1486871.1 hypothetical protein CABS01_13004 [Colletotrichum abscissum]
MPDQIGVSAMAQLPGRKPSKVSSNFGERISSTTGRGETQPKDGVMPPIRATSLRGYLALVSMAGIVSVG